MTARALGAFQPDTPEWHEARRWRVGASDIGQIMGWSPWGTRADLLAAKQSGEHKPASRAMERGNFLEPSVLAWAAHREGLTIDPDLSAHTYVAAGADWMLANPDAICTDGTLIEAKTTSNREVEKDEESRLAAPVARMLYGRAGTDRAPACYLAQVVWQMGVLELPRTVLAVHHGATNGRPDNALSLYIIPANPRLFATLARHGERFLADLTLIIERKAA